MERKRRWKRKRKSRKKERNKKRRNDVLWILFLKTSDIRVLIVIDNI
jgi:hypothetical protein